METYQRLLLANKAWAQEKIALKPNYFKDLAVDQQPDYLWIGCSDSRVPAEEITGTQPGEIFVHRNIANLVHHTDVNLNAVLQYAVEYLKVKHIIVCGHYGCGGVRAAMSHDRFGLLNYWLRAIKETYEKGELGKIPDEKERLNRLVEMNIEAQVRNLTKSEVIQKAWLEEKRPIIHGWAFGMDTGLLKQIQIVHPGDTMPDIYQYKF